MYNKPSHGNQQGYALTEVLIAGVIAASVLMVTATGISTTLKAINEASELEKLILDADKVRNQLQTGINISEITNENPGWIILHRNQLSIDDASPNMAVLVTYEVRRKDISKRKISFTLNRLEAKQSL